VDGILVGPDEGEKVPRGDLYHRILAELPELEVIELRFSPDFAGVEPHSHSDHVDSFYVLEGEAEFVVGDEAVRAGPGTYVAAPVGVVHGFRAALAAGAPGERLDQPRLEVGVADGARWLYERCYLPRPRFRPDRDGARLVVPGRT
jgi:mannose-6-phosphate isomerase-like protein (cupin superfamily)